MMGPRQVVSGFLRDELANAVVFVSVLEGYLQRKYDFYVCWPQVIVHGVQSMALLGESVTTLGGGRYRVRSQAETATPIVRVLSITYIHAHRAYHITIPVCDTWALFLAYPIHYSAIALGFRMVCYRYFSFSLPL